MRNKWQAIGAGRADESVCPTLFLNRFRVKWGRRFRLPACLLIALITALLLLSGCSQSYGPAASVLAGGDAQRGMSAISYYGCGSCHTVAGITSAHGLVGPPLTGVRDRMYIAGMLNNRPENLIHWIRDPKSVNPKTAMPVLGLSQQDAADIAAYLYSK
jgi:cytochrome c